MLQTEIRSDVMNSIWPLDNWKNLQTFQNLLADAFIELFCSNAHAESLKPVLDAGFPREAPQILEEFASSERRRMKMSMDCVSEVVLIGL